MSRLDELIKELCPDGVEWHTIDDISLFVTVGIANSATHAYSNSGVIMFRNQNINPNYLNDNDLIFITDDFSEKYKNKKLKENDILVTRTGYPGQACVVPKKYEGCQTFTTLIVRLRNFNKTLPEYVCQYINSGFGKEYVDKTKSGAAQQNFGATSLAKMSIPIPPIEVQREIVKILDAYSESVSSLQQELEKELTARKKQYEYYSSRLFLDTNAPEIEMSELADFVYGYTDTAKDVGDTRFVRITDINEQGYLKQEDQKYITMTEDAKKSILRKGDIIMARTGATFGKVLYFDSDFPSVYASFLIKIIPNEKLLSRYYWHFTKTSLYWEQAKKLVTTGGQPQFNTPAVKKIRIPIPPIEKQERIVSILDRFDKLCNEISDGLPAEIEARQKQYEYYRDKLLTFKEKKN